MAVLSDADRQEIDRDTQRNLRRETGEIHGTISAEQNRAIIDALDDAMDGVVATLNAAIPQPMRGLMNQRTKAWYIMRVITRRFMRT